MDGLDSMVRPMVDGLGSMVRPMVDGLDSKDSSLLQMGLVLRTQYFYNLSLHV